MECLGNREHPKLTATNRIEYPYFPKTIQPSQPDACSFNHLKSFSPERARTRLSCYELHVQRCRPKTSNARLSAAMKGGLYQEQHKKPLGTEQSEQKEQGTLLLVTRDATQVAPGTATIVARDATNVTRASRLFLSAPVCSRSQPRAIDRVPRSVEKRVD